MSAPDIPPELWLSNPTLAAQLYAEHLASLQPDTDHRPLEIRQDSNEAYWQLERMDSKSVELGRVTTPRAMTRRPPPGQTEAPTPRPDPTPQSSHIPITSTDSDNPRRWMPSE